MSKITKQEALDYHSSGKPGKIEVVPTKPYASQRDLSLAYSPGVAEPCIKIAENKDDAYKYTSKANLVAVITNGTAVLGLGDIGPEASKPVMEGKALLFKTIDFATSVAANCLYLQVNKQNNAQQFYSKHGFTIREASILEIGGGYIMDDYIMELALTY